MPLSSGKGQRDLCIISLYHDTEKRSLDNKINYNTYHIVINECKILHII